MTVRELHVRQVRRLNAMLEKRNRGPGLNRFEAIGGCYEPEASWCHGFSMAEL